MDMRGRHRSLAGTIYEPTGEKFVRHPKTGRACLKRVCKCGKEFYAKKSEIENGGGKYCCHKCYSESQITRVDCICGICGKSFSVSKASYERGEGKYCSKKCQFTINGSLHPLWCGGKSDRGPEEFTASQRRNIFEKYDWKCAVTGIGAEQICLHIHHIVPISKGGTSDASNGIPLTPDIHKQVHYEGLNILPFVKF